MLRVLTAGGKQRETQVPGHLLPVVGKALRWGKSGVSMEVGGEFPIGFKDLVNKGKGILDLVAETSRESGFLCGIVPLGVGHMA